MRGWVRCCVVADHFNDMSMVSFEYGVTTWRTILELDALGVLWRMVSREWRRALEMLRVMLSK